MNNDKVFAFVVNNTDARYSNIVKIDEKNGKYCLKVSLTNPGCISFDVEIDKSDVSNLLYILKPVNEWVSKDTEKREVLDTNWFIYFYYGENTIRANGYGYKDFPDDYDAVASEISNWIIAILKRNNEELNNTLEDDFKNALVNRPHYIFACFANASMPHSFKSVTIEQKGDVYYLNSSSSDNFFPNFTVEISENHIDKLCEILIPLMDCKKFNNDIVLDGESFSLNISYNDIKFSVNSVYNESIDFSKILFDIKSSFLDLCREYG